MAKGKDILDKGPGDVKDSTPQMPEFRGDSGESSAKGNEDEGKSVHYKR